MYWYMKKRGRPKQSPDSIKEEYMELRLFAVEKEAFNRAAEAAGLSLSAWVRERLRRIAKKELEEMNLPVAFLERLS
jgi:predicted HicB family RNase H-like nuclease